MRQINLQVEFYYFVDDGLICSYLCIYCDDGNDALFSIYSLKKLFVRMYSLSETTKNNNKNLEPEQKKTVKSLEKFIIF